MKRATVAIAVGLCMAAVSAAPASAASTVVYNASVQPLPGNLPSVGAEAYSFSEFGDQVTFAGTARTVGAVRITLSSWACQQGNWVNHDCVTTTGATFPVPITLNIYNPAGNVAGSLITHVTKTFNVPYRPTANLKKCNGSNLGKWYKASDATCYNGKAANITFNLKSLGLTLPDTVVIGLAYNTTHYGYSPIGESPACYGTEAGCAYDALNIALGPAVTVGSKQYPDTVFQNASFAGDYCDNTLTPGTFQLDSPANACWSGYVPAIMVKAS
jgi:hypothetical protein